MRVMLFIIFFAFGAAAVAASILCQDLIEYYTNRQLLEARQELSRKLADLNADYQALLVQLQEDPNLIKRIAPLVLGTEANDANTVYPEVTVEQLLAVRRALTAEPNPRFIKPVLPGWISRCSEPGRRVLLFVAGSALILISFICFGPARQEGQVV